MVSRATTSPAPAATAEPSIRAVKGRTVTIRVPAGFASVNLQVLTAPLKGKTPPGSKPPGPVWKTVASKLMHDQAAAVQLQVPRLTSRRLMRVFGVRPNLLPASLLSGATTFAPDPTSNSSSGTGGALLSLDGAGGSITLASGVAASSAPSASVATRTVSESDIWKIDGDRLYFFNSVRGLQVFDIAQPDHPSLLGTLRLPGAGEEMYLLDSSHVVLLKNENFWWSWIDWDYRWSFGGPIMLTSTVLSATPVASFTLSASPQAVSAAASLVKVSSAGSDPHSVVVADVSGGAPVVLAQVPFTGSLRESRLVGQVLYVASEVYEGPVNGPIQWGTRLTSFDLADPANPVQRSTIFVGGWSTAVYASDQYFLVASGYGDTATVKAFDISDATGVIVEAGQVTVPGTVADKFKMNQTGTTMTVVSSGWRAGANNSWATFSTVSTFSLADPQNPVALGTLDGPVNEQLFATRFDGQRLYMVTSQRNWDPLAIIDLSTPAQPTLLGSVELAGFSTYIQPLGDRLVTIGFVGHLPTVELYDVSDATAPRVVSTVGLGTSTSWTSSEATWDEKAFSVLPESNLILMPISSYEPTGGYTSGVQLIDLLPTGLVKRGVVQHQFYPRRAGLHGTRILSIASNELLTVNAADRDHPVITADLDIAWPVDRTFLMGSYLLELGGDQWGTSPPTLTVTAKDTPDDAVATLALPDVAIRAATLRDGVLYVLQGAPQYYFYPLASVSTASSSAASTPAKPPALTLSTIDVSHLPAVKLLGQVAVDQATLNYYSDLKPLWVNDRTLIFSTQSFRSWGWRSPYQIFDGGVTANAGVTTLTSAAGVTVNGGANASLIAPLWYWYGGNSTQLFAFDVTLPAQPKFASQLTFGQTDGWDFGNPLAANDTVYLGYKVLPTKIVDANAQAASPVDPVNRYFLKLIDYSDSSAPVVADDGVNLPGDLRALGRQGTLLYTVGRQMKVADGSLVGTSCTLQASSFDGAAAHLLDQIPLQSFAQPFLVSGANLLVLNPQPAQLWQLNAVAGSSGWGPNPASTTLDAWSLGDNGKFSQGSTLTLNHELSLGQVQTLGVLRSNDRNIRLLDLSDFTKPLDLGLSTVELNGYSSLENAAGNAQDGLWLPLGAYGVDVIPISH